jgi:hypothetical protein
MFVCIHIHLYMCICTSSLPFLGHKHRSFHMYFICMYVCCMHVCMYVSFVCIYECMYIYQFFSAGDEDVTDTGAPKAKGAEPIDGFPPTFTEKPKIVPNESGTLVTILQNFLRPQFTSVRNKLECLSLAFLSRLGQCLWVRQGAYSRMEYTGRLWPHSKTSH